MTKGATPQERYDNQSADERRNAEYVASNNGGLSSPPEVEWKADYEWCYDHHVDFRQVIRHAEPRSKYSTVQIPRIHPPISLQDMYTGSEAIDLTPRHVVRLSQVVREEWYESIRIPTRIAYAEVRNVLVIHYREEVHLFSVWIGDDPDEQRG